MESQAKTCSRCKKFKSAELFYKQGDRYESICKDCKKEARKDRSVEPAKEDSASTNETEQPMAAEQVLRKEKPKSYEDLGLTKNEFLEVVEFFKELMRLDQKGR